MLSMAFLLSRWPRWTACSHKVCGAGKPWSPKNHSSTASLTELKLDDKPTCAIANSKPGGSKAEQRAVGTMGSTSKWLCDSGLRLSMLSCKCATCSLREQTCLLILSNASVNWGLSGRVLHSSSALMTYMKEHYQIKPTRKGFNALHFASLTQRNQNYKLIQISQKCFCWKTIDISIFVCMQWAQHNLPVKNLPVAQTAGMEHCPQWHEQQATGVPTSPTHTFATWRGCSARKFQPMQHNR